MCWPGEVMVAVVAMVVPCRRASAANTLRHVKRTRSRKWFPRRQFVCIGYRNGTGRTGERARARVTQAREAGASCALALAADDGRTRVTRRAMLAADER